MRRAFLFLLTGYLLMVSETAWGNELQVGFVRIDGLLALIVWYAIRHPVAEGIMPVCLLGFMSTPLSALPSWSFVAGYALVYLTVRYIQFHVLELLMWQQMLIVMFTSLQAVIILTIVGGDVGLVWPWGIGQAILNGITAPVWFFLFNRMDGFFFESIRSNAGAKD